ncbi:MAG TPA: quinonprotein alcohol dehydrogenase, partial [Planctomycetaceae bacterium]|nr:quinonprotein alcohol dehydrogenase [Planctomycetaceae bacterium]
ASPIATDEHIYFFDRDGTTTVVRLGDSYDVVSQNKLDAGCMASPAVADDAIYIRTTTHLYCIKK